MAVVRRTFVMECPPAEAQARFLDEILGALEGRGFKLRDQTPGHLLFGIRGAAFYVASGLLTSVYWLWRLLSGHRLEVDFTSADRGTSVVEIYGRAGWRVNDAINLLGRNGHWPSNPDDPDWVTPDAEPEDPYREWDAVEEVDADSLDRITRRALRKAGRLP